jgi:hypothetical protein
VANSNSRNNFIESLVINYSVYYNHSEIRGHILQFYNKLMLHDDGHHAKCCLFVCFLFFFFFFKKLFILMCNKEHPHVRNEHVFSYILRNVLCFIY